MTVKPIEPGAWVIINDGFSTPVHLAMQVVKTTAAKIVASDPPRSGERHFFKDRVLFVGTEPECGRYAARLTSSVGLMKDEVRKSRERHDERARKILVEAKGLDQ